MRTDAGTSTPRRETGHRVRGIGAILGVLAALLLTGCAAQPAGGSSPTARPTDTPSASASPTVTTAPSSTASPSSEARGCANGRTAVPSGATTATIPDVDGDGKPDLEFYSERSAPFTYGIRTAAGGVYELRDDLAGPGGHGGWTAAIDDPVGHVTVLDDGRDATLHAWVGCRFVTTQGSDGRPYRFGLNGFSEYGTGVTCERSGGSTRLAGVLAKKRSDGRYDIATTTIDVSADGAEATNGATVTRWTGLSPEDPRVEAAMRSSCPGVPEVRTSGR
jgi:hypothetical protein